MKDERIAKLAHKANIRLKKMEKKGYKSPAYLSAQARLEMMGARKNKDMGRRFKEGGYFKNKNEALQYETMLKNFLNQDTSTIKGYESYRNAVLNTAEEEFHLTDYGVTDEQYMQIWEALPDDENKRLYGSSEIIAMVESAVKAQKRRKEENRLSISEIIDKIQSSSDLESALSSIGVNINNYSKTLNSFSNDLGKL